MAMDGTTSIFGQSLDEVTADNLDLSEGDEPVAPLAHARGERLQHRLSRDIPRAAQWMLMFVAAAFFCAAGGGVAGWAGHRLFIAEVFSEIALILFFLGAGALLFGVFLLFAAFRKLLASRSPEAAVETETAELRPGRHVRVMLIQPGPVKLGELALSLVCERSVKRMTEERVRVYDRVSETYEMKTRKVYAWHTSPHRVIPVVREQDVRVARGSRYEKQFTVAIPEDAEPSVTRTNLKLAWRFEVDGSPALLPDYRDDFPIVVRAP